MSLAPRVPAGDPTVQMLCKLCTCQLSIQRFGRIWTLRDPLGPCTNKNQGLLERSGCDGPNLRPADAREARTPGARAT